MGAKILSWGAEFSERYKTAENWAENSIFNIVKLNKSIGHHSDFYFSAVCKCVCHHWRNNIFYRHRACLARAETVELVTLSTKQRITTAFAHSKILLEKTAKTVSIADLVTQISLQKRWKWMQLQKDGVPLGFNYNYHQYPTNRATCFNSKIIISVHWMFCSPLIVHKLVLWEPTYGHRSTGRPKSAFSVDILRCRL